MTPLQQSSVDRLKAQGFAVVERCYSCVRLTKGADARLVLRDGTTKRAQHKLAVR